MDKEELKDNIMEEVDDVVELTEEEGEEATGGEGGYGNVQFKCACNYECLNAKKLAKHLANSNHKAAAVYHQKTKGKSSRGTKIGNMKNIKITKNAKGNSVVQFTYPAPTNIIKKFEVTSSGDVKDITGVLNATIK